MQLEPIIAFTLFSIVTAVTPGPNNVMLTATGANVGIRRGMPHLLGITVGFGLMQLVFIGGVGSALISIPSLVTGIKVVGIAVLLWLAWKIATAAVPGRRGAGRWAFSERWRFSWSTRRHGSFAPVRRVSSARCEPSAAGGNLRTDLGRFGIPCMLVWLGFGAAMQVVLRTDRALRTFNIAMGLLLVATVPLLL